LVRFNEQKACIWGINCPNLGSMDPYERKMWDNMKGRFVLGLIVAAIVLLLRLLFGKGFE